MNLSEGPNMVSMRKWLGVAIAVLLTMPGLTLRLGLYHVSPAAEAIIYGVAIVGAAFMLSWAAEVFQLDVSQGLALAMLALVAILPEYIVDATFAWKAAQDPTQASLAVANMTGANRILIGIAWPLVVLLYYIRTRRTAVELPPSHGLELVVLLAATVYAFVIPIKGTLSWIDFVVLVSLFLFYLWRLAKLPSEEPHLIGPAQTIASLGTRGRRVLSGGLALYAAALVLLIAEHFAEALVSTGHQLHIDEFFLVQWVAPLASEAPEFVVVSIFAWRRAASAAMGALVSSKINQWTLLVAMLPLVYAISLGALDPMPLDTRQREEVLLTAAQSLFAVILLLDLRLSLWGAGMIFGLFAVQFVFPDQRVALSVVYGVLSIITLIFTRGGVTRSMARFPGFSRLPHTRKPG
jgi:cation:H+ antiporter